MGIVYTPPTIIEEEDYVMHMVFLAGSIEMDLAVNWQKQFTDKLSKIENITILNPRRSQWDASWEQVIENPHFNEQVNWELDGIESSDTVIFYFDPKTKSPITLLEYGLISQFAGEKNIILCCPDGFYRKGNVDIVYERMKKKILEDSLFSYTKESAETNDNKREWIAETLNRADNLNDLLELSFQFLTKKTTKKNEDESY